MTTEMNALLLAVTYGTLAGGGFVRAPETVNVGGFWRGTSALTEEQANSAGYMMLVDERPDCGPDEFAVPAGYSQDGMRIVRRYEVRSNPVEPRRFSKLKIYAAVSSLGAGAWDRVKTWLEGKDVNGVNGWMAFLLAQEIGEDHPLFASFSDEMRQELGISEEDFRVLLDGCLLEGGL